MTFRTAFAALTIAALVAPVSAEAQQVLALSERDQQAYSEAYAAIDAHNWAGATRDLSHVDDTSLVQSVRGRMLASPNYRASYSTLNQWLVQNDELGVAYAVYERAQAVHPHRGRGRRRHAIGPEP